MHEIHRRWNGQKWGGGGSVDRVVLLLSEGKGIDMRVYVGERGEGWGRYQGNGVCRMDGIKGGRVNE